MRWRGWLRTWAAKSPPRGPGKAAILESVPAAQVKLGDLKTWRRARASTASTWSSATRTRGDRAAPGRALLRAGFRQYDLIGGYQKLWVGYRGTPPGAVRSRQPAGRARPPRGAAYRSIYASRPGKPLMRHLKLVHSTEEVTSMSVKIAFASSTARRGQHFGAAEAFCIYEFVADDVAEPRASGRGGGVPRRRHRDGRPRRQAGREDRAAARLRGGYCNAVGASAIKQLLAPASSR